MNYSWVRDRSEAHAISLDPYELYTQNAPAVVERLGATTMGDLTRVSVDEVCAAARTCGCSADEEREIVTMLGEYLSREGLSLAGTSSIVVTERQVRPPRPALRAGFVEHRGDGFACFLIAQPARVERYPSPHLWTWELDGYLLTFQVPPLDTADVETLAAKQHVGTMDAGPWGAYVRSTRAPHYAAYAGPGLDVVLFDAQLHRRACVELQAWSPERKTIATLPSALVEVADILALSLAPVG